MRNLRFCSLLAIVAALMCTTSAKAQEVALKTNLLYDALTTPNLGVEVGLGKKMTGQLYYGLNPWNYSGSGYQTKKAKHWVLMPEVRWWTCSRMNGWFFGVHAMGGEFNAANIKVPTPGYFFSGTDVIKAAADTRVQGKYLGGGFTAGYQWILSRHWNLEAELGVGYNHVWYDQFPCSECSPQIANGRSHYVGLTKAGLALMYVF